MAASTYTVTTSSSGVNKIWRKVQGELQVGFGFDVPEWDMFETIRPFKIDVSAREITVPVDINEGYGIASIDEGAVEALPSSPNVEELTLNYQLFTGRFTASVTAQLLDQYQRAAQLKRQLVYQGMKKVQDLSRHWGDYLYGLSTGYLAQTSTNATQASGTYTLYNMYGQSSLAGSGAYSQIADKFKVGDRVALIRAGALVTNGIGTITAVTPATPSIAVTWNGSVDSDAADYVVKANSIENTTIAGTDYNHGMTGLIDMLVTASVHGLSSSSVANWSAAYSDTTSTRFTGVKLRRFKDEISFQGGGKMDKVFIAPGVYRDALSLQQAALRFSDPFALEMDGDIKSKGVSFFTSKRVPSGWVIGFDSRYVRRLDIMPKPNEGMSWGDGIRMENTSGYIFPVNLLAQMVCLNRKAMAYAANQTEQ